MEYILTVPIYIYNVDAKSNRPTATWNRTVYLLRLTRRKRDSKTDFKIYVSSASYILLH